MHLEKTHSLYRDRHFAEEFVIAFKGTNWEEYAKRDFAKKICISYLH